MEIKKDDKQREERLNYLMQTHKEVRSEIQMRITQRDNFAIQFVVAVGAIVTLGLLDFKYSPFLFFLLPIVTIFYSLQILYSYSIHSRCHKFLCEEIEPELGELLGYKEFDINRYMWESYCQIESKQKAIKTHGIRKGFFEKISLFMPLFSSLLFAFVGIAKEMFDTKYIIIIAISTFAAFFAFNFCIILTFNKKVSKRVIKNFSKIDYINKEIAKNKEIKKVVFLDRDGTINKDKVHTHKICDLEYFPDTFSALKELQEMGYELVIVSNQDGIRKEIYDAKIMHEFNQRMIEDFKNHGINIAAIYYSPYDKMDNNYSFKPNPGMLLRAKFELNISMENSFFIGDQVSDVIAGYRAKVESILVTTGIYKTPYEEQKYYKLINPKTCSNLEQCVKYIKDKNV